MTPRSPQNASPHLPRVSREHPVLTHTSERIILCPTQPSYQSPCPLLNVHPKSTQALPPAMAYPLHPLATASCLRSFFFFFF